MRDKPRINNTGVLLMKNDFVMPVVVLVLICMVISGALALTNSFTKPVIEEAAALREAEARNEIIPSATGFDLVEFDGLPDTVRAVYRSHNDVGYIFILTTGGYGGDMRLICGIGPDGNVIRCSVLEHSETKGLGSKVSEPQFENKFDGKDSRLEGVDAIGGATISSNAFISAVMDAFEAFVIIGEAK